jgi:hypothetical protein
VRENPHLWGQVKYGVPTNNEEAEKARATGSAPRLEFVCCFKRNRHGVLLGPIFDSIDFHSVSAADLLPRWRRCPNNPPRGGDVDESGDAERI